MYKIHVIHNTNIQHNNSQILLFVLFVVGRMVEYVYSRVHLHGRRYGFSLFLRCAPAIFVIFLSLPFFRLFRFVCRLLFFRTDSLRTYIPCSLEYHAVNTIYIIPSESEMEKKAAIGSSAYD